MRTSSLSAARDRRSPKLHLGQSRVGPEHLEVDDRPEAELRRGGRRRAREAVVGGRRDPGCEEVGGAAPGDRQHLRLVEPALAGDVGRDPVGERPAVGEAAVDRVLEVGVGVDDSGQDQRSGVVPPARPGPTSTMRPSSQATRPPGIGGPSTGSTQSADTAPLTSRARPVIAPNAGRAEPRARSRSRRGRPAG